MLTMTEGSKEMERRDFHLMMIIAAFSACRLLIRFLLT